MEKHFLDGEFQGPPGFKPEPWYNSFGDCVVCQIASEAFVADRIDEVLTIYRSAIDDRPIGYQIKGVQALIRNFGWDGLAWSAETADGEVTAVSIAALLLAAYEEGPKNTSRRVGYASAFPIGADCKIDREDLVPA